MGKGALHSIKIINFVPKYRIGNIFEATMAYRLENLRVKAIKEFHISIKTKSYGDA